MAASYSFLSCRQNSSINVALVLGFFNSFQQLQQNKSLSDLALSGKDRNACDYKETE